jgi:hypothetical protein
MHFSPCLRIYPQGPRSSSKLIADVSETNEAGARRFPLFPHWTSLTPPPTTVAGGARRGDCDRDAEAMDAGFDRLDAYLQWIA